MGLESWKRKLAFLAPLLMLSGCAPAMQSNRAELEARANKLRNIVMLAPDIKIYELSAGGMKEQRDEWGSKGKENVERAIIEKLKEKGVTLKSLKVGQDLKDEVDDIKTLYQETNPDPSKGFNDPATGKAIAKQFIAQGADVLFQIAGLTGQGVLEAACDAGIYGIGVDVDQVETLPNLSKCIVTSAEKKLKDTVQAVTESAATDSFQAGTVSYNAASTPPAIGLSPFHDFTSLITSEIQAKIDAALAAMKHGSLKPPRTTP